VKPVYFFLVVFALCAMLAGSSYAEVSPGDTIGIWFLNEIVDGVAKDSSGNGHDGELIGDLEVVNAKFNKRQSRVNEFGISQRRPCQE
jgi:autotransporter translocation and assembly factor TamB